MNISEKTEKNGKYKIIIVVIIILAIMSLIGVAFARYITRLNGTTQAPIARWNFRVTAGSSENLQIDLADTRYINDTTEVDRTKVAPGTKGAIQLNVDGSGSQVSLQYNIDMILTQIPENLIFYEDEEMTTALLKENGKIHLDGYFGVNDANKTATKNLYWQWKLETGTTQAEINSNDVLDSRWMGERITLGIEATGKQVTDNPATKYAVTFDLNGGTLANHGDSTQITKQVTYGETYGDLPIPTREGYNFKGWTNAIELPGKTAKSWGNDGILANNGFVVSNFKENTKYTVEYNVTLNEEIPNGYTATQTKQWGQMAIRTTRDSGTYGYAIVVDTNEERTGIYKQSGASYNVGEKYHCKGFVNTSSLSTAAIIFYTARCQTDVNNVNTVYIINGTFSDIYFYEGDILLKNVTDNTEVTIKNNHTLRAIWEPVSNP